LQELAQVKLLGPPTFSSGEFDRAGRKRNSLEVATSGPEKEVAAICIFLFIYLPAIAPHAVQFTFLTEITIHLINIIKLIQRFKQFQHLFRLGVRQFNRFLRLHRRLAG